MNRRDIMAFMAAAMSPACGGRGCPGIPDVTIDQDTPLIDEKNPGASYTVLQKELGDCYGQGKEQHYETDIEFAGFFDQNPIGHFAIGMRVHVLPELSIDLTLNPENPKSIPGFTGHGVIFGNLTFYPDPEQKTSKTPVALIESFNKRVPVETQNIRLYPVSESPLLGNEKYRFHMYSYFDGDVSKIRYTLKKYQGNDLYDFYDSGYVPEYKKYDKNLYKTEIIAVHVFGDETGKPWQVKLSNQRFYITH